MNFICNSSFLKKIKLKRLWYCMTFNAKKVKQYQGVLDMFKYNHIEISDNDLKRVNLNISGKNNVVIIKKLSENLNKINMFVFGDNNKVVIDENVSVSQNLSIYIGQNNKNFGPVSNCDIIIGKNTSFESCALFIKNSNSSIKIGNNCMFAFNITLYHTDSHPIFDINTKQIINKVKDLFIGDHVWLGANVTILKNTHIADDNIIGWGSVVSGCFLESNCVIAGNPACTIKRGVTWDSNGAICGYIENNYQEAK